MELPEETKKSDHHHRCTDQTTSIPEQQGREAHLSPILVVVAVSVVATLVMAAILYNWALQFMTTDKDTPKYELECSVNEEGFFIVEVVEGELDCYMPAIDYYLETAEGEALAEGRLWDIWGLDIFFYPWSNFSHVDNDSDADLGKGDYIVLKPAWMGGLAENGQNFRLVFDYTEETMAEVILSNDTSSRLSPPGTQWEFNKLEQDKIILDATQPAASHVLNYNYYWEPLEFRLQFSHNGSTERQINITFMTENETLFQEERLLKSEEDLRFGHNSSNSHSSNSPYPDDFQRHRNYQLRIRDAGSNETLLVANYSLTLTYFYFSDSSFLTTPFLIFLATGTVLLGAGRCRRKREKGSSEIHLFETGNPCSRPCNEQTAEYQYPGTQ